MTCGNCSDEKARNDEIVSEKTSSEVTISRGRYRFFFKKKLYLSDEKDRSNIRYPQHL